jgi:endonuclease III-like uncharacterized protein
MKKVCPIGKNQIKYVSLILCQGDLFENFQKEFSNFFRENRPKRKKLEKTSEKKLSETVQNAYK